MGARRKLGLGLRMAHSAVTGRRRALFVGWSLTDRCNLSCDYCGRWDRGSPELSHERLMALPAEMAAAGVGRVGLTGGEPLLHTRCLDLMEELHRHGIAVALNSNGLLLRRSLPRLAPVLSAITLSIDGDQPHHDGQRGAGSWERAVRAARLARSAGIDIALHTVVTALNAGHAVAPMLALAEELDCLAGFTVLEEVPAMGRRELEPLTPTPAQWHAVVDDLLARKAAGERRIQNSVAGLRYLRNWPQFAPIRCSAGLVYARIEPDGSMFGCGNLVREPGAPNLARQSFGAAFEAMGRGSCTACWCDTRVEMNLILSGVPSALRAAWVR